ncbi:GNAT family N-acetyltransferase [Pseudonocardia spinosispora]|uniref:GNAT family N-acetyltransferase n=1 Tax=Pseudonocardia spinosispora TaxID=103441 RepID=UPI0003FE0DBB|nr:GNAT family N-acetyltransferase [Pseudonocardia spinosispora]
MSARTGAPTAVATIRPLSRTAERLDAVRLYRQVFGLADTDPAINAKLLCGLQRAGGSAIGAFDTDGRLVGFVYGFVGLDGSVPYHHSQTAAVDAAVQGQGVGRRLKLAQAEVARTSGVRTMRWTYDPLQARNAHFNLDVLGAVGRWFHRDYYDMRDGLGRTDRVVVDWPLDREPAVPTPVPPPEAPRWGRTVRASGGTWLAVPADWAQVYRTDRVAADLLRDEVATELDRLFGDGAAMVSCRRVDDATALYRFGAGR